MADLAGWPYWKVISITGQAGSGTDYQVKLEIGDSAGGDFHLEGHCTNFPQDIRITDDDGTTLLDHFVEDITADPIVVQVEVKDDLGSNQDIRVYYGKNGETTASNGADTFIQYHGPATSEFLDSLSVGYVDVAFEAKIKAINGRSLFGLANTQNPSDGDCVTINLWSLNDLYFACVNDAEFTQVLGDDYVYNTWYHGKIILAGSTYRAYLDDVEINTGISTNLPNESLGLFLYEYASYNGEQEWSFARKYNSLEPAFSSAGAEQSTLVPVFIRHNPALTGGMV